MRREVGGHAPRTRRDEATGTYSSLPFKVKLTNSLYDFVSFRRVHLVVFNRFFTFFKTLQVCVAVFAASNIADLTHAK